MSDTTPAIPGWVTDGLAWWWPTALHFAYPDLDPDAERAKISRFADWLEEREENTPLLAKWMADHDATNDYGPLDPRIYVESITLLAAICPDLSPDQTRRIAGILADSRLSPDARLVGVMATELAGPKMDRDVTTGELADALAETADHMDALLRDPAFIESIEGAECAGPLPMPPGATRD
jgi:hypothetical protein